MGLMLAGVRRMGRPFTCEISEYMRTMVYRIPEIIVREGHLSPAVLKDMPDFRATIATDPVGYIREHSLTRQYELDANFAKALRKTCSADKDQAALDLYLVIQFKEDMQSFQAGDGQCIKIEHDGIDELAIVDCDDADMPRPDDRASSINAVLTAVRIAFEVTDGMGTTFDRRCYMTDDGECVYHLTLSMSADLTVKGPLTLHQVATKAENARGLVNRFDEVWAGRVQGKGKLKGHFAARLEQLIDALQLDPSMDDAYLRLWFLQLYHRTKEFGATFEWQFENQEKPVREYRRDVAHPGVDRMDGKLLRSFQKAIHRKIERRILRGDGGRDQVRE